MTDSLLTHQTAYHLLMNNGGFWQVLPVIKLSGRDARGQWRRVVGAETGAEAGAEAGA